MTNSPDNKKLDQAREMNKKIVKTFLIIGIGMLMIFAMLYVLSLDFDKFLYKEVSVDPPSVTYPPDFNEDIFKDEEYLEKDRLINFSDYRVYQDGGYISIDAENYTKYGDEAIFIYGFIHSIINGDSVFYNSCFSDKYIELEGEHPAFTMQKLYNINVRLMQLGEAEDGTEFAYIRLEYCIFKNNQTFRNDIGSDHSRTQFLTLIKDSHNHYKIQGVTTIRPQAQKVLNVPNLIIVISVAVVIGSGIVAGVVLVLKKEKRKRNKALSLLNDSNSAETEQAKNDNSSKRAEVSDS